MKAEEVYSKLKKMIGLVSVGISNTTSTQNPDGSVTITINFTSGSPLSFTMSPVKGDNGVGIKDALIKEIQNGENTEYHLVLIDDKNNNIDAGKIPISSGGSIDLSNYTTKDNSIKSINLVDAIPTGSASGNQEKCLQLIFADDTKIVNVSVKDLVDAYDDTQVKSDINDLKSDKQDKTDNSLETTDKTVVGSINEVNGNQLDTVSFSADYKNIILNRKNGLNPYVIPISSIIHNAKLTELNDIDSADIGDGKTLVYDATTQKHKYVSSTGTDELVKMDSTTDAKHLSELIDKSTVVNDNGILKVKKLDGQEVTIAEINYLKGLTMNVMDLVNMFANGGVKIINTPVATYADLLGYDKTSFIDGITYIIYVLSDETHDNAKTTYLIDKTTPTPTFFGNAGEHRDFTTSPIDLANEVTGKLGTSNIDVDSLWALLTINDTYKTLTTKDEVFGTHGAKAMYDELVTAIGEKANASDLTTHTDDTDIHITSAEREAWNNKANDNEVIKKADIKTTLDENSTNDDVYGGKAIFDAIKNNCVGKETVLYEGSITATGTYTLADDVNNYDFIIINHTQNSIIYRQSNVLTKSEISKCIDKNNKFLCVYGDGSASNYTTGYFNNNNVIISDYHNENITSITGYKFGQITVQNTITNPSPGESYSTDEQLTGGTWIDGKPIYRKVIQVLVTDSDPLEEMDIGNVVINKVTTKVTKSARIKKVSLTSFNIKQITRMYGSAIADRGSACVYCPCDYGIKAFCHIYYDYNNKWLEFRVGEQYTTSNTTWDVVLEYTKTTD